MQRRRPRRFAENTTVPIGKTKGEIEDLLRHNGATQCVMGSDTESQQLVLGFTMEGRQFRLRVKLGDVNKGKLEQKERQAWRTLLLLLKGKLEVVAMGLFTMEHEFLANVVLPNGSTVADDVQPKLLKCYESGKMPNLLPMATQ